MTSKKFSQLPLEELKLKESMLRKAALIYMASISVMVIAGFFLTLKNGFNTFTIIPLIFIFLYIFNGDSLKSIRKEITEREE